MSELPRILRIARRDALATLTRVLGDLDAAEDAVQEAAVRALASWPDRGVPHNPTAWLVRAGRNVAIDRARRRQTERAARPTLEAMGAGAASTAGDGAGDIFGDDLLRLIFTCCHPALERAQQVALTLRTVAGLSPDEIARALLLQPRTLEQRLTRAKRRLREERVEYVVPGATELPGRLDAVLAVVYLIFNEGYRSNSGADALRPDLCRLAIRLSALLCRLVRGEPEITGLAALMLLTHARAPARLDGAGALVPLEAQDRTRWDPEMIAQGRALLDKALLARKPGPYQLQAAIAAIHADAPRAQDTDWNEIAALYRALEALSPSAVVRLGHAVAVARARGTEQGLSLWQQLRTSSAMDRYPPFHVVGGGLLEELGRAPEAIGAYRRALELGVSAQESAHLRGRIAELEKK